MQSKRNVSYALMLLTVLLAPFAAYAEGTTTGAITVKPTKNAAGAVLKIDLTSLNITGEQFDLYLSKNGYASIAGDLKIAAGLAKGTKVYYYTTPTTGDYSVPGDYYIKATDDLGATVVVSNKFTILKVPPTVTIKPTEGVVGTSVEVKGEGFPKEIRKYEVYIDKPLTGTILATGDTDAEGKFTATFHILNLGYDGHRVLVVVYEGSTSAPGEPEYSAYTFFSVRPDITVAEPSVAADTAGQTITVSGTGFPADTKIAKDSIRIRCTPMEATAVESATTHAEISIAADGSFPATLVRITDALPNFGVCDVIITVAGYTWTFPAEFLSSKPTNGLFKVKLGAYSGKPEATISFLGMGFKENATIELWFIPAVGTRTQITLTPTVSDANGALKATFNVPHLPKGVYTVNVKDVGVPIEKTIGTFEIIPKVKIPEWAYVGDPITIEGWGFPYPYTVEKWIIGGVTHDIPDTATTSTGDWGPVTYTLKDVSGGGLPVTVVLQGKLADGSVYSIESSIVVKPKVVTILGLAMGGFTDPQANIGDYVKVTGTGYLAGETVSVTYMLDGEVKAVAVIKSGGTAGSDGKLTVVFDVPTALSPGTTYEVKVAGPTRTNTYTTTLTTYTLGANEKLFVNLQPDGSQILKGYVGDSIVVTGTGTTLTTVDIKWDGTKVATATPTKGYFTLTITAPETTHGNHTISYSPSVTFTIHSKIVLSPTEGYYGTTVTVTGRGFKADELVTLKWSLATIKTAKANDKGTFTATFSVPTTAPGIYAVEAEPKYDPDDVVAAYFTVLEVYPVVISADVGSIHFPAEIVEFYFVTTVNGKLKTVEVLAATLYLPDGTTATLTPAALATGVYKATYTVPVGKPGFYALLIKASDLGGLSQGASVKGFQVSPTLSGWNAWLVEVKDGYATIKTDVGTIKTNVTALNAKVVSIEGAVATIKTDVGTIKADVGTIKADVGTIKTLAQGAKDVATDAKTAATAAKSAVDAMSTPLYIAVVMALIAAIAAVAGVIQITRKIAG